MELHRFIKGQKMFCNVKTAGPQGNTNFKDHTV